MFENITLNQQ